MMWNKLVFKRLVIGLCFLCFAPVFGLQAQENPGLNEVYVTTQYNTILRLGPGTDWERLTTLPAGTTLRATGRTVWGDWFQVAYTGALDEGASLEATQDGVTYGWVAYWLLIWTGDILELPVDGVETVRTARRTGPLITIGPGTRYYVDEVDPSLQVMQTVTEPVVVELTGRIGSTANGFFVMQFLLDGQYYWTASWEIEPPRTYGYLPDGSYLYSYGRLEVQLRKEASDTGAVLDTIGYRWRDLDAGRSTTCNAIPAPVAVHTWNLQPSDQEKQPIFAAAISALQSANVSTNLAIARFEAVCANEGTERLVAPEDVQAALADIADAKRNLTLVRTLLVSLQHHSPLLGNAN